MLEVRLLHQFPGRKLDVIFAAPPGVTALFGRSGAGKTTVINAIAGLFRPASGRIALDDHVLLDTARGVMLPAHRRRIACVFQDGRLFPHLTVRQNLVYGRWFADRRDAGRRSGQGALTFDEVVAILDIAPLLARRPGTLSGGEKQRVAIGRALLSRPEVLLLDEPLAALDAARKEEILPCLERLRDGTRLPMIHVSHSVDEVARLATTIVLLEEGRVILSGSARDVLSDPGAAPHLGLRNAGAVLPACVEAVEPDGLTRLRTAAGPVWVPSFGDPPGPPPGTTVRMRIAAQDVILSRTRPEGLSALNILPVTVAAVRQGDGPGTLVQLQLGPDRLLARVTRRSAAALGLVPGLHCHAILKAVAVAPGDIAAQAAGPETAD
jgi:molybdate transport system ATP-binding protein